MTIACHGACMLRVARCTFSLHLLRNGPCHCAVRIGRLLRADEVHLRPPAQYSHTSNKRCLWHPVGSASHCRSRRSLLLWALRGLAAAAEWVQRPPLNRYRVTFCTPSAYSHRSDRSFSCAFRSDRWLRTVSAPEWSLALVAPSRAAKAKRGGGLPTQCEGLAFRQDSA